MCSPTLFLVGAGSASAMSSLAAGGFADDISKFNQAALNRQAEQTIEQGKVAEQAQRVKTSQLKGEQKTAFAAAGVDVASGSPVDIITDTEAIGELDALTIRGGAETEAANLRSRGISERLQGKLAKRRGIGQAVGGLLTTGGSIAAL